MRAGLLYLFLQVVLGGLFTPTQKPLLYRYSAITTAGWGYAYGTGLLLLCVLTSATDAADWDITPISIGGSQKMNSWLLEHEVL